LVYRQGFLASVAHTHDDLALHAERCCKFVGCNSLRASAVYVDGLLAQNNNRLDLSNLNDEGEVSLYIANFLRPPFKTVAGRVL
jgi:hypothetical protein